VVQDTEGKEGERMVGGGIRGQEVSLVRNEAEEKRETREREAERERGCGREGEGERGREREWRLSWR